MFVLRNAKVYTADESQPWASTIVVRNRQFEFVGDDHAWNDDGTLPVHDAGGRLVIPGIVDSHTHPAAVAKSRWHTRLPETDDVNELLAFIRRFGEEHPPEELPYIYFEYYSSTLFGTSGPTKELLDSAIADRPVLCQDANDHAHWLNSKMLELMEVTKDTPDPVPGLEMFVRDENGEPTGHCFEHVYVRFTDKMFDKLGWRPPERVTTDNIRPVLRFFTEHGVTSLFDAVIPDEEAIRAVSELDAAGELNLLYEGAVRFRGSHDLSDAITAIREYQDKYGSDRVRVRTVKLFLDGTNEIGNSAVLEPLCKDGCNDSYGEIRMERDELVDCLLTCNTADVDVHIHLVGDRAFRIACDAVELAQMMASDAGERWRIHITLAHCELVDPADMARPAQLGIIVNWTPHWSGGYFGEQAKAYLGAERWNRMYEFNAIADSGALLTFSSDVVTDYELNRADPFFGMQVAATRIDPQTPLDPAITPDSVRPSPTSRLPVELLAKGYTIDGARQLHLDDRVGSIQVGKLANFVVLSDDLFSLDPHQIGTVKPTAVFFEGDLVAGSMD